MAQTPRCTLDRGRYQPPLGGCAIYSQCTIYLISRTLHGTGTFTDQLGVVIQGAPIYIGPVPWMLWGMRMVGRAKMGLMGPWMILQSPGLGSFGVRPERFRSGHRSFFPHGYDTSQHPLVFIWFQCPCGSLAPGSIPFSLSSV